MNTLIDKIEELDDDRGFTEFPRHTVKRLDVKAVLVTIDGDDHWFPYSQMRHLDGDVYVAEWILKKEGLL
jgi:hypothetical protein